MSMNERIAGIARHACIGDRRPACDVPVCMILVDGLYYEKHRQVCYILTLVVLHWNHSDIRLSRHSLPCAFVMMQRDDSVRKRHL